MAANKLISIIDVDKAIDFTIANSDQLRAAALAALQRVLCAESVPLGREIDRLTDKFGAGDARIALLTEQLKTNKAFAREVEQETVRAQIGVPLADANTWVLHGFARDVDGKGLANSTIAPYDSIKPAANWVKELGHVCADDRGYFKLEAPNPRDYSATPVYLHVLNAAGATLYSDDVPLAPRPGLLNYREFVVSGKPLDCPSPPPPSPPAPSIDLSITIDDSPDPVAPNANLTYTLTVTSHTQVEAKNVKVTDTLAEQTTFISASGSGFTCTHTNGVVNCTLPALAGEATATVTIVVKISPDAKHGTVLNNTATVIATTSDPDTGNNTAATTTTVVRAADLSITKTDTPDSVAAGQNVTYTLQVTNAAGASDAQNVTVTDTIPANTALISAAVTSGKGWVAAKPPAGISGKVVFSKASVAAGETASFQIVVRVNKDTTVTTISNTATVASSTADPDSADNTVESITKVRPRPRTGK